MTHRVGRIYARLRRVYVHLSLFGQFGAWILVFDRFGWVWLAITVIALVPISFVVHYWDKRYFLPSEQEINMQANPDLKAFLDDWRKNEICDLGTSKRKRHSGKPSPAR